ncbi:hypothetical protein HW555_012937 [Spodoptera exigua]|uniref:Uncharacterized protein n=1 Tax=Spodoptera exigua TaxID=7107 RepID=A0A835G477_SPOEX|nr:hypothetical protein HW555_012937 [Spodoptera exigua]
MATPIQGAKHSPDPIFMSLRVGVRALSVRISASETDMSVIASLLLFENHLKYGSIYIHYSWYVINITYKSLYYIEYTFFFVYIIDQIQRAKENNIVLVTFIRTINHKQIIDTVGDTQPPEIPSVSTEDHTSSSEVFEESQNSKPDNCDDRGSSEDYEDFEAHALYTSGQYWHYGFEVCIRDFFHDVKDDEEIYIKINIDGLPIFNSSKNEFWPIIFTIENLNPKPMIIGIYYGKGKPQDLGEFLSPLVAEFNTILKQGIKIGDYTIGVTLKCFVCDSPARSFIKEPVHTARCVALRRRNANILTHSRPHGRCSVTMTQSVPSAQRRRTVAASILKKIRQSIANHGSEKTSSIAPITTSPPKSTQDHKTVLDQMSVSSFECLLKSLEPHIRKNYTNMRNPVEPVEMLGITLSFGAPEPDFDIPRKWKFNN